MLIPHSKNPVIVFNKIRIPRGIWVIFAGCPESLSQSWIISFEFQGLSPTNGNSLHSASFKAKLLKANFATSEVSI
jgi:hypothetical protein